MIYIIESNEKEKTWMEWAAARLCIGKKSALFVNAECLTAAIAEHIAQITHPVVIYALKKWTLLSGEKKQILLPLLSRDNVGTIAGYPFSLYELHRVYRALEQKKAVSNAFVVVSIRGSIIRMLRTSLNTLRSEEAVADEVQRIEKTYGVRVRAQEIREKLEDLASVNVPSLAPPIAEGVVEGIFCTIGDTLFYPLTGNLNKGVLARLHAFEEEKKPVALWTNGDCAGAERALFAEGIKNARGNTYSVIHMRHYAGKKVELVIGPFPELRVFQERYRIFPQKYIKM